MSVEGGLQNTELGQHTPGNDITQNIFTKNLEKITKKSQKSEKSQKENFKSQKSRTHFLKLFVRQIWGVINVPRQYIGYVSVIK